MSAVQTEIGPWALVPRWVRKALRGQSRALELYVVLADVADYESHTTSHRRGWLAEEMGCSADTVDRAMNVLVDIGAVEVTLRFDEETGASRASDYLVRQVQPVGGGRTNAEGGPHERGGEGRNGAAGGPHERGGVGRVSADGGGRASAAHIEEPPTPYEPPSLSTRAAAANEPPADAGDARGRGAVVDAFLRSMAEEEAAPAPPSEAGQLAELIRRRYQDHADHFGPRCTAVVSATALAEADLLLRRGPKGGDDLAPAPVTFEEAVRLVDFVFDHLNVRDHNGFCWADQIRSASGLREKWHGALRSANGRLRAPPRGRVVTTIVPDDLAALSDLQLVDLLKSGAELERVTAEIAARLDHPAGQAERLARFRDLLGGAEGWPRGTSGPINTARFMVGDWIRAKQAAQPALTRGA